MIAERLFLVGMPGSGKTTMGKLLSKEIGFHFIDLDEEIVKSENCPITDIFKHSGEDYFRKIEQDALIKTFSKTQTIISTGGGAPCFHNNMKLMNQNGLTIFINIPLEIIQDRINQDSSRPLMQSNTLGELYNKRIEWYQKAKLTVKSLDDLLLKIKPEGK